MDANDNRVIHQLFDDYLRMYANRDDRLTEHFSEDFSGFTGGGDFLVKNRDEWVAITRQDFAQVKEPLRIELKELAIQSLTDTIAVTTGFFTIHLPIEDHILSRETARLVLIFRKESNGWKISHSSISIPYYLVKEGEVYPLQELTERNLILEEQIAERTNQLSEVNDELQLINEKLAQEIIEHKHVEEALRESECHFRMLTENVSDVVWKLDSEFRFTYISPSDERLRGYSADEVIGHHVFEIFDEEGIATIRKATQQSFEVEQQGIPMSTATFEVKHRCKDGSWIWGEICSTPEFDSNGKVTGFYGVSREITERKQMQDQVRQLAFYDPLTKLPNRRLFNDRLSRTMAVSKRKGCYCALMFLDLDNFKPINDSHGHIAGDLLLIEVAERLKRCVRETDTIARFGGDEFIVILSELKTDEVESSKQARIVAEKIRTTLADPYQLTVNYEEKPSTSVEYSCTVSIGVALFQGHNASPDDLLKWADVSMYKAKESGRNSIRFYHSVEQVTS